MNSKGIVLVTGATGYVGGRLVPYLIESGYRVRVLVRDSARLQGRPWLQEVEVFEGDVLEPETLPSALEGVKTSYYLIHSMMTSFDFHKRDLISAQNFSQAAKTASVERIIYLGGLGDPESELSEHLRSRQQTGDALRKGGVPVTEFQAAIIVGSGSVSFEMIRYLTERLPLMICPRWVYTKVQPISIQDILAYLLAALESPHSAEKIIEIGGADVLSYGDMMLGYAKVRDLRRILIPVPVLTPRLSSYWIHWMTPISAKIARPLIEGVRNEVVVRSDLAKRLFPQIQPLDYMTSVGLALEHLEASRIETTWSDALVSSQGDSPAVLLRNYEGMFIEQRQKVVNTDRQAVYNTFTSLGGERGWLYLDWAWRLRGALDRLIGGVGFRRGRRHPTTLRVGDTLGFWRVEAVEEQHLLRLRAEMKLPGQAWLQFEVKPHTEGLSVLKQSAFFAPKGLVGLLYWYLLYPLHSFVYTGLVEALVREAT